MASFTEQAVLKVVDQSTAQINKINAALKKLDATAKALKSKKIDFSANLKGVDKSQAGIKKLSAEIAKLKSQSISLKVNATGLTQTTRQLAQLRAQSQRPISVATHVAGRPPAAALAGGVGHTLALIAGFGAVTSASQAAAAALRSLADNTAKRDRTTLQSAVQASAAQRKVFDEQDKAAAAAGAKSPLPLTKDQFDRLRTSLLGDVQGAGDTPEEQAINRAKAADTITRQLEEKVLPRLYAQDPTKSKEETLAGLRQLVQGINLASTDIVDAGGRFSKDGLRVLNAIQKAMSADPEISPSLIKTTLANLKTAGYTLDEDSLARVLINAGSRGVRAANEAFQAMRSTGGGVDVKALNDSLEKLGLISGGKRKGAKGEKGLVPGSSKVKDPELWATDPAAWFQKNYVPGMEEKIKKAGVTPEMGKAWDVARKNQIEKDFAGMRAAGVQGITDMILGFDQMNQTLKQANLSMAQDVPAQIAKSWTAAAENVGTAWNNMVAGLGDNLAKSVNLAALMQGIADGIANNPGTAAAITGLGITAAGALGVAATSALLAPSAALTGSATALTGSAAALRAAAAALGLGGRGLPGGTPVPGGVPPGVPGGGPAGKPVPVEDRKAFEYQKSAGRMPWDYTRSADAEARYGRVGAQQKGVGVAAALAGAAAILIEAFKRATPEQKVAGEQQRRRIVEELKDEATFLKTGKVPTADEKALTAAMEALTRTTQQRDALQQRLDLSARSLPGGEPSPDLVMKLKPQIENLTKQITDQINKLPWPTKPPYAEPGKFPETGTAPVMKLPEELTAVSSSFNTSVSALTSTTSTFSAIFSAAPGQIGSGGKQAADHITAGAASAGSAYGAAAAAQIRAAVANVNVNVNVKGGGGDTGNINNANGNK